MVGGVWQPTPAEAGVEEARRRLERAGLELSEGSAHVGTDLAEEALRALGAEVPSRAEELFVEQVVVATAMREEYHEAQLQPVEVSAFLGVSRWFFNSLWHEHP